MTSTFSHTTRFHLHSILKVAESSNNPLLSRFTGNKGEEITPPCIKLNLNPSGGPSAKKDKAGNKDK